MINTYNLELELFNEECSRLGYNGLIEYNSKIYKETEFKKCDDGYILKNNKCITHTENCKLTYGNFVYGVKSNSEDSSCYCIDGYKWNNDKTGCIKEQIICLDLINGYLGNDGACYCNTGFDWSDTQQKCTQIKINFKSGKKLSEEIIKEEKFLITKVDNNLSKRMSGNILLQVEKNGEGWYVFPDNQKKYYLGRPADAFSIMRNLGLGIKNSELNNYLNTKFPSRLSGKIMLDVEQNGEAYYVNPNDLKGYYLNRPADAFNVMRNLGLGITNDDIRKIDVGEVE